MTSWQTLSKVQYLMSSTPADDRVGRHSAPDVDTPAPAQSRRYVQCSECESSFQGDVLPVHTFNGGRCPGSPAPAEPARRPINLESVLPGDSPAPAAGAPDVDASEPGRPIGKRFVLAGHAIVTLVGKESRYTFKINRKDPEEGSQYTRPAYFVSLLTGQDNTSDYTYVGMLDDRTGTVRLTRKSTYRDDSAPVKAFNWIMARVWRDLPLPAPARLLHAGRCGRCGRLLTVPSSVESGFGPECIGKV